LHWTSFALEIQLLDIEDWLGWLKWSNDPPKSNEPRLEAIQMMAWREEFEDAKG